MGGVTSYTVGYDYDAADRLTEIVYPDGSKVNRSYTDRHQLHEVFYTPNGGAISDVIERGYDNAGRLTSTTYGNNLTETRTYRTNGAQRDNLTASIGITNVTSFAYTYDANKNKTAEADGILNNFAWSTGATGYDVKDRLIEWARTNGDSQEWDLTEVGNWASTTIEVGHPCRNG